MLSRFFPDIYIDSVKELPVKDLKARGIKLLIFDIDNTLAPFDEEFPGEETAKLISSFMEAGFICCLLSNNRKERVERFNERLKIDTIHRAGKPGVKKLRDFLDKMGIKPEEAAIIGDQVFTDIFCGRRLKIYSILTKPISGKDQLVTWIKRGVERLFIKVYLKRGGKNENG